MNPIRFGVIGIHGFSRHHLNSIQHQQATGAPVRLVAAVAHARQLDEAYAASLENAGVRLVATVDELLALRDEIDVITVPVGIHLHVPMAEKALRAGYAVYLEKPVAGTIQDVDHLAVVQRETERPLFIGYQDGFQPVVWEMKRMILAGDLGRLRRIVFMAAWPRMRSYYSRNDWAGRLRVKDTIVLDSILNNACAHFLNLSLFAAGSQLAESANPLRVHAELYRANPIESADTFAVRVETREGVEIVCLLSHACQAGRGPVFRVECERGVFTHDRTSGNAVDWRFQPAGGTERPVCVNATPADPFRATAVWLLGKKETPVYTLPMARPQTLVVNGAHLAGPIRTVPAEFCLDTPDEKNDNLRHVQDMNRILDRCFADGALISECGLAPWAQKPGTADVADLRTFALA